MSFATLLSAIIPVYLIAVIGLLLRRLNVLTTEMDRGLFKIVIHCLYPALIIDKILGNPLVKDPVTVGWGIGIGFFIILTGFGIAYLTGRVLGLARGNGLRTFSLSAGIQNFGYVAVPILLVAFQNSNTLGLLFVHSLGVEIAIWTVGLMLLSGSFQPRLKLFINGPIIAVILGLGLVYTGFGNYLSPTDSPVLGQITRQTISWLGACAFPIALLLIGATIYDLIRSEKPSFKITFGGLIVRVLIMPFVILCAAKYLPLVLELKQVLVVQAAMPAAVTPVVIARHYGGRPGIAVQVVIATSLIGIITIPFIISWGSRFVGV